MSERKGYTELPPLEIRPEPDKPSSAGRPGGSSGSGSSWNIGFGSGGSGFGGGFGGSSRKKAKKRAKKRAQAIARQRAEAAARAKAETEAHAQAQRALAAAAAHEQLIETLVKNHSSKKISLDAAFLARSTALAQSLESEITAAKKPPVQPGAERWQLYLISKEKNEIAGLIASKKTALQAATAQTLSFDGHNPLARSEWDFKSHVVQHSAQSSSLANDAYKRWEASYTAALESQILSSAIITLSAKTQALSAQYAEQEIKWREIDAIREGHRRYEEHRNEQIKFKARADSESRHSLVKAANTLHIPAGAAASGAMVFGRNLANVSQAAAAALERAAVDAFKEVVRVAAIRAGQIVSVTFTALTYSPALGNGELTPEQRRRLFQGVGLSAQALGLPADTDLREIADSGGSVELPARIKAVPVAQGTELHVVGTGGLIPASVPVVNAVLDPLSGTYQAQTSAYPQKHLVFSPAASIPSEAGVAGKPSVELYTTVPQTAEVPAGVDTRFNDCVVCFPAELGIAPQYFSFESNVPGVVTGKGQVVTADWWKSVAQSSGVPIPAQIGDQHRYREFQSVAAFDRATWRSIAEDPVLSLPFDEINRKRMSRGFPPYAPKATWAGERREFEFRNSQAANDAGIRFDLDQLRITYPNSTHGLNRLTPTFLPWPVAGKTQTWTPLVPPGNELLGPRNCR